jgi:hypothetical protein
MLVRDAYYMLNNASLFSAKFSAALATDLNAITGALNIGYLVLSNILQTPNNCQQGNECYHFVSTAPSSSLLRSTYQLQLSQCCPDN